MLGALEICLLVCINLHCFPFVVDISGMSKTWMNLTQGQENKHINNGFGIIYIFHISAEHGTFLFSFSEITVQSM